MSFINNLVENVVGVLHSSSSCLNKISYDSHGLVLFLRIKGGLL